MLFKFLVFLSVALVSAASQDLNTTLQNELNKVTQVVKNSLLNKEPSSQAFDINEDRDGAIANFLNHSMENYHTWLAKEDPLKPDLAEITINATLLNDADFRDLDAILKISNQYMANHSKLSLDNSTSATSDESYKLFSAGRDIHDGESIIFGGDYIVNGSMNVSNILQIPFSGQGKWTLKGKWVMELLSSTYTVDENGYMNFDTSRMEIYMYSIVWNYIEFEGLAFNYEEEIDATWMPKLENLVAKLYHNFLLDLTAFDQFSEHNLPKRLLKAYLTERFQSTKLEDIVSGWQPTSTTDSDTEPTTPIATDPTDPPDTGKGNNILGSFWVYILTLLTVFMQV